MANGPRRLAALILDGIFLGAFLYGLWYINISSARSFFFYLPIVILGLVYKPFMEYYYGATLGKMLLRIRVVDRSYRTIGFTTSLLRNCILFIVPLGTIPFYFMAFQDPLVVNQPSFTDFSTAFTLYYPQVMSIALIQLGVVAVDGVFLLVNGRKGNLSLKDLLAATCVIQS